VSALTRQPAISTPLVAVRDPVGGPKLKRAVGPLASRRFLGGSSSDSSRVPDVSTTLHRSQGMRRATASLH
jgi:hypothetical protein